jgi:CBS domain-containing membrane protein
MMSVLVHLSPAMAGFRAGEPLRAGFGALIGITLCAAVVGLDRFVPSAPLMLVAPLGATAVLVFCVPNSPLAQPWSAVIGNIVSTLVAILSLQFIPAPWTTGVAVGGAIASMMLVRALHPPGGAVALMATLDPAPVVEAGLLFALIPIGLLTASLVVAGIAYNRATGRVYPFRHVEPIEDSPALRLGLSTTQLGELLIRFNQATNLGIADLGRLLAAAEEEAAQHRFDGTTCADVMTRDLITIGPDTPVSRIASLFQDHPIKSLPVVDDTQHLCGLVLQADLLKAMSTKSAGPRWRTQPRFLRAVDVMRGSGGAVAHDLPVGTLLNRLAAHGSEVVPVTQDRRLVGILTRSDIIRLLLRGSEDRHAA